MVYSRISGTGHFLPDRIVVTQDSALRDRTGIHERHLVSAGETTADLAEAAARRAMSVGRVEPEQIDLLIVGTVTPDVVFPNLGCLLQKRLGLSDCPAFSLEAAASGFIYALSIADRFVATGQTRHALIIGSDTLSRFTTLDESADAATLFADGAGAVVLEPADAAGVLACRLGSDPRGGPNSHESFVQLSDNDQLRLQLEGLGEAVNGMLAQHRLKLADIDWLIPHQSNPDIISQTVDSLGVSAEKSVVLLNQQGNTGAASLPIALDVAINDGRIHRGDLLLLETIGGGFAWGTAIVRY